MDVGDLEGLTYDELFSKYTEKGFLDLSLTMPNGESWKEGCARAWKYISTLEKGSHLIFGHSGMLNALGIT